MVAVPCGLPAESRCRATPPGVLDRLLGARGAAIGSRTWSTCRPGPLARLPGRNGSPQLRSRLAMMGIVRPWVHQVLAAELAYAGRSVVVATGTSSGKSLAYLLPGITAVLGGASAASGRGATVLYLAPTKALAADQLRTWRRWASRGARAATFDGDTLPEDRDWVREHASWVLTNPDMLHRSLLPSHQRWTSYLRALSTSSSTSVMHIGVFSLARRPGVAPAAQDLCPPRLESHLRASLGDRLRTRCLRAAPHGLPVVEVTDDASPRGPMSFALWEPGTTQDRLDARLTGRRTATAETAELLADLVAEGVHAGLRPVPAGGGGRRVVRSATAGDHSAWS